MNLSFLEITLLAIQILLVPLFQYILNQHRVSILNTVSIRLDNQYDKLIDLIEYNKKKITRLEDAIKHRSEISKIRTEIMNARLKDVEIYLGKTNGFQARQINDAISSGFL